MIITTTPNIEGYKIIKYFDPIIINKAENIIDVSECLYGIQNSNSAISGMNKLKKEVFESMKLQAESLNADAVVSLNLDYDQIGGKSGGMLMVSAIGTPVLLKKIENNVELNIIELVNKYFKTYNEEEKILLEYEIKVNNIDEELKNRILKYLEILEKSRIMEKEIEMSKKEKEQKLKKEKEEQIMNNNPIKKKLIEENVRYIRCKICSSFNYTDNIIELKCNQCGNSLETEGEKVYY